MFIPLWRAVIFGIIVVVNDANASHGRSVNQQQDESFAVRERNRRILHDKNESVPGKAAIDS